MNCPYCENAIPAGALKCPACGAPAPVAPAAPAAPAAAPGAAPQPPPPPQAPVARKSAFTAGCLSFLICGLGQMYNGQVIKGIVLLISAIVLGSFTFGVGSLIILIVSIIDAAKIADKINSGRQVGQWEFF